MRLLKTCTVLLCAALVMGSAGVSRVNPKDAGSSVLSGLYSWTGAETNCIIQLAADDISPEVAVPSGCSTNDGGNILLTATNSGDIAITTFDGALPGQILYLIGQDALGGSNLTTIADASNFTLSRAWSSEDQGAGNPVLVLITTATDTFVEIGRINGLRDFDAEMIQSATLNAASGDEVSLDIQYTVNKASSGDDYGIRVRQTDTASPGTSYLLDLGVGAGSKFTVTNAGTVSVTAAIVGENSETLQNTPDGSWTVAGSGGSNNEDLAIDLETADSVMLSSSTGVAVIDSGAINIAAAAASLSGNITLESGGAIVTTSDGDLDLTPNGTGVVDVTDSEVHIGDGTYSFGHSPVLACEGAVEVDGVLYADGGIELTSAETITNAGDGVVVLTGVGGSNNENASFDLESSANTVGIGTSTGVTLWDWGALGLASGSIDLSSGNATSVGDVELDSLTSAGTSITTNSSTLVLQQSLDAASGNVITMDSHADAELTASSTAQVYLFVNPEIEQTGSASYSAIEVDVTETSTGSGSNLLLDLQVADSSKYSVSNAGVVTLSGAITGANGELFANSTDNQWVMTDVGSQGEALAIDLGSVADTIGLSSTTGVTLIDAGAIGLASGAIDLSEGNLTNGGDLAADSVTADSTQLALNYTTLVAQQGADASSGDVVTIDSHADAEMTASSGSQSFLAVRGEVAQSGTSAYTGLEVDMTETSTGSGATLLLDLQVADSTLMSVDSSGNIATAGADFGTSASPFHNAFANVLRVGTDGFTADANYPLHVSTTTAGGGMRFTSVQNTASGVNLTLHQDSSSPTGGDVVAQLNMNGEDDGSGDTTYANLAAEIASSGEAAGSERGIMRLKVVENAASTEYLRLDATAAVEEIIASKTLDMGGADIHEAVNVYRDAPTSDSLPPDLTIRAADAWPFATGGNASGGDLWLDSGIGQRIYTVLDYSQCSTDTVTIVVNGSATSVLTEGSQWTASPDNDTTATSLASAINAVSNISATAVGPIVGIVPGLGAHDIDLARSDGTCTSFVQSVTSYVRLAQEAPLCFDQDCNTTLRASGDNELRFHVGGVGLMDIITTSVKIGGDRDLAMQGTGYILSLAEALTLGTDSSPGHGGGVGDVIVGADLEVDGVASFDGAVDVYGSANGDAKGASSTITHRAEALTCTNDASLTTSGLIPDGAFLYGVSTRITTALGGSTSFTAGDGVDVDIFGAQATVTQGETTSPADFTANVANPQLAAAEVVLTFAGGNCTSGVITVVAHVMTFVAPTSN